MHNTEAKGGCGKGKRGEKWLPTLSSLELSKLMQQKARDSEGGESDLLMERQRPLSPLGHLRNWLSFSDSVNNKEVAGTKMEGTKASREDSQDIDMKDVIETTTQLPVVQAISVDPEQGMNGEELRQKIMTGPLFFASSHILEAERNRITWETLTSKLTPDLLERKRRRGEKLLHRANVLLERQKQANESLLKEAEDETRKVSHLQGRPPIDYLDKAMPTAKTQVSPHGGEDADEKLQSPTGGTQVCAQGADKTKEKLELTWEEMKNTLGKVGEQNEFLCQYNQNLFRHIFAMRAISSPKK